MVNGYANFSKSNPKLKPLVDRLKKLAKSEVYVGVPAKNAEREGKYNIKDTSNNAELLFILSHGSPLRHIPARPVLQPAIEDAKEDIGRALANASRAALNNDPAATKDALENAGMVAQNAAHNLFDDPRNGWAANAPLTIKLKGSNKPMVDTGQMRNAIVYVVRAKNGD